MAPRDIYSPVMETLDAMRLWGPRHYAVAASAAVLWALVSGTPTDLVNTPLFTRMTPVVWWDYPFWMVGAILVGLLVATFVPTAGLGRQDEAQVEKLFGGGLLSVFAVGCPICNKLVVLALGVGGAMTYFAPLQPVLGFVSTGLLLYALRARLSRACPTGLPRQAKDPA